jgi:hypothetical protein
MPRLVTATNAHAYVQVNFNVKLYQYSCDTCSRVFACENVNSKPKLLCPICAAEHIRSAEQRASNMNSRALRAERKATRLEREKRKLIGDQRTEG